jgi:hypothetical protein
LSAGPVVVKAMATSDKGSKAVTHAVTSSGRREWEKCMKYKTLAFFILPPLGAFDDVDVTRAALSRDFPLCHISVT